MGVESVLAEERGLVLHRRGRSKAVMKIGNLARHTPTGVFVTVLGIEDHRARILFVTGKLVGFKAWYSKEFLKVIHENR